MGTRWWLLLASCLLIAANGCATWSAPPEEPSQLPGARVAADCVTLEVALVKVPNHGDEEESRFWQDVDEQHLAPEVRRKLQDNGLRTGVLGSQIPEFLRASLEQSADPLEALLNDSSLEEGDLFARKRRLHVRPGSPRRIPVTTQGTSSSVVLHSVESAVRATRFEKPIGIMGLCCEPLGDGRVQLEVVPMVEHGEMRQQIGTAEGSWMLYSDRPRHVFDSLAFRTVLSPGQTLLITAAEAKGVGAELFARNSGQQRSMLLVRLAQTQMDDLFQPAPVRRSLVTTAKSPW